MALPVIQPSFIIGEVAPALYGRVDLARLHSAASTQRNMFVGFKGGAYSRAGTAFVGFSKQTGRGVPPRLITFQDSINQGLALEFGNFYMRVISNGAFVTTIPIAITGITQANPAVVTVTAATGGNTATANSGSVTSSYAPADVLTINGGTFSRPAQITITNTSLKALSLANPASVGGVYAPADTVALTGGTQSTPAQLTVLTTQVTSATVTNPGTGGSNGQQVVTGTTGTGTKFQAIVTVSGGGVIAVVSILVGGSYTVNPTTPTGTGVSGASLAGTTLNVTLGIATFSITNAGVFTANPAGGTFTQASTSGSGTGATFSGALMRPNAVTFSDPGVYTAFPANPIVAATETGSGVGATFTAATTSVAPFNNGDWVFISGVNGMTQVDGSTYVVAGATTTTFQLRDVYGTGINSTAYSAYTSAGTAATIYTQPSPYSEADLAWLKFTQSADVMSLCCVNQLTGTEYQARDLSRISDSNFTFATVDPTPSVGPPSALSGTASASGTVNYQYVVTAVSPIDGTESIASNIISVNNAVDIHSTSGSITLTWAPVAGVLEYNLYKATPGYGVPIPAGVLLGYAGSAYGTSFVDSNIIADFSQVPPLHQNPFARGQIVQANVTAGGSGYTIIGYTITSATGSGLVLIPVLIGGALSALIVADPGKNYANTDTITITGNGAGATAAIVPGAHSGTFPGSPAYFQQRRTYAFTLNSPDFYFMSQPGAFTNFDKRIPTIASDAVIGSPWSVQVDGIQFMLQTPGGLLTMTGQQAWLLVGTGSFATNVAAFGPSNQTANAQAFTGCSATVPPLKINYDVLYVSQKGSHWYDLPYQLYSLSEPIDLTESSSHLFDNFTVKERAGCEQPFKMVWSLRSDGVLCSLTFYKSQQVAGWARHDTQGYFRSVCAVTEPGASTPVDALYVATERTPGGVHTAYMIERMDNRNWPSIENSWCVDAGLTLAQPAPNSTLAMTSATGLGACSGITGLVGGANYSAGTTASVVDRPTQPNGKNGPGVGAVPVLTIVAGVVTNVTFAPGGTNYLNPELIFSDPAGSDGGAGASATITINNSLTINAAPGIFAVGNVGDVIRAGGGIMKITAYTSATQVTANMLVPITQTIPNSGGSLPQFGAGTWTQTTPVTQILGLTHLIGSTVTGVADGAVIPPTVVNANGGITLGTAASAVTVGLGFTAQLQGIYLDTGESPTVAGQRKKVASVTIRVENTADFQVGTNQPDGSTLSPMQIDPVWSQLSAVATPIKPPYGYNIKPLYTGDTLNIPVGGGWEKPGQIAVQQSNPLPMSVLAFVNSYLEGDTPSVAVPPKQAQQSQRRAA